jgi:hypothetical protein
MLLQFGVWEEVRVAVKATATVNIHTLTPSFVGVSKVKLSL